MAPRPKKPSSKVSSRLLEAINFLSCVTKDEGMPYETHVLLSNKTAVAYNDILSAGTLIEEEIYAAPNNKIFKQALSKCGNEYSLVIDGTKIVISSGKFKANIPCIDPIILAQRLPDNPVAAIDDRLKEALAAIDVIKPEPNATQIYLLSFLLNGQSLVNTDGKIIIERWHGIDLPRIAIPKSIIPAILNNPKKLWQFGFSNSSVTFFFEDKSWVKSQLYNEQWPSDTMDAILNRNCNPSAIPPDFFAALDAISGFSPNGTIYFNRDKLCSHKVDEAGATYEVAGLPKGPIYSAKYLSLLKSLATKIDFTVSANGSIHQENYSGYLLFFFGDKTRGVIAGHG